MALPVLLAPMIYGSLFNSLSEFEADAAPPDPNRGHGVCGYSTGSNFHATSCCWKEGGVSPEYFVCQTCIEYFWPLFVTECGNRYTPFTSPGGSVTGPLGGEVGPVGPNILPFNLRDILNLPENASYSIGVEHGPNSDTIRIEIPKALSSSILNQTATGFEIPKALSSSILNQSNVNQTATGLGYIPQPPMVQNK